jgi:hypothetical protein
MYALLSMPQATAEITVQDKLQYVHLSQFIYEFFSLSRDIQATPKPVI